MRAGSKPSLYERPRMWMVEPSMGVGPVRGVSKCQFLVREHRVVTRGGCILRTWQVDFGSWTLYVLPYFLYGGVVPTYII